jgi:hypothetical protein
MMNETNTIDFVQQSFPAELSHLFAQLAPEDVEQFYQSYQLWSLQHDIAALQAQINTLQQQIEHNAQLMQSVQLSSIALSALAQLQAYGVSDTDLLDRMLERGDSWLDHTVQLLVRCEELNVIRSDYTQWCENALEGAYDWITSMDQDAAKEPVASEPFDENIEAALLQKLTSEDDTEPRLPVVTASSVHIADQATLVPASNDAYTPAESSVQSHTDEIKQLAISTESPIQDHSEDQPVAHAQSSADISAVPDYASADPSATPAYISADLPAEPTQSSSHPQSSAGTDSSCPPDQQSSQQQSHEHDQSTYADAEITAEPENSYGTTEAINLEALKISIAAQEEDAATDYANISGEQSTDATNQEIDASASHSTATEITADITTDQSEEPIDHNHASPADILYDRDEAAESSTEDDSSTAEATDPTVNHAEQTAQQANEGEEQTTFVATAIPLTSIVTARMIKSPEHPVEQTEPLTDHTAIPVHLQEDDLALPPVTNTYQPAISRSDPIVIATAECPKPALQTTTPHHKPDISWHDPGELPPAPPEKRSGFLARLFRHAPDGSRK